MMKGLDFDHIIVDHCLFLLSFLCWSLYCLFVDLRLWYLQNFLLYPNVFLKCKDGETFLSIYYISVLTIYPTYTIWKCRGKYLPRNNMKYTRNWYSSEESL